MRIMLHQRIIMLELWPFTTKTEYPVFRHFHILALVGYKRCGGVRLQG